MLGRYMGIVCVEEYLFAVQGVPLRPVPTFSHYRTEIP